MQMSDRGEGICTMQSVHYLLWLRPRVPLVARRGTVWASIAVEGKFPTRFCVASPSPREKEFSFHASKHLIGALTGWRIEREASNWLASRYKFLERREPLGEVTWSQRPPRRLMP